MRLESTSLRKPRWGYACRRSDRQTSSGIPRRWRTAPGYAEFVLEQVEAAKETCADPVVLIEQRVDFSRWVEQGFGTADCIIIADGTLRVIDYKYGLGVLSLRRGESADAVLRPRCFGAFR
jgi:hypothetical protein